MYLYRISNLAKCDDNTFKKFSQKKNIFNNFADNYLWPGLGSNTRKNDVTDRPVLLLFQHFLSYFSGCYFCCRAGHCYRKIVRNGYINLSAGHMYLYL